MQVLQTTSGLVHSSFSWRWPLHHKCIGSNFQFCPDLRILTIVNRLVLSLWHGNMWWLCVCVCVCEKGKWQKVLVLWLSLRSKGKLDFCVVNAAEIAKLRTCHTNHSWQFHSPGVGHCCHGNITLSDDPGFQQLVSCKGHLPTQTDF